MSCRNYLGMQQNFNKYTITTCVARPFTSFYGYIRNKVIFFSIFN